MAKEIPTIEFVHERGDERINEFGAVIPAGWYKGAFKTLEGKESKKESTGGYYVNMGFEITEGAQKGTMLFEMFFPWAEEEKTAQATRRRLNSVLEALELPGMTSFNELLNLEMMIKVKTQEAREQEDENTGETKTYAARSQIANYKSLAEYVPEDEPAEVKKPAAASKPAAGKPAGNKPPFGAKKPAAKEQEEVAEETTEETAAETKAPAGNKPPWVKK